MSQESWFRRVQPDEHRSEREHALERALADERARVAEAEGRIDGLERAIDLLEEDAERAVVLEAKLAARESAYAALAAECESLRARLAASTPQRSDRERGLAALNARVTELTEQLTRTQRERDDLAAMHEAFKESAGRQRLALRTELSGQRTALDRKEGELSELNQQLAHMQERAELAIRQLEALRVQHAHALEVSEARLDDASRREHGLVLERDKALDALARAQKEHAEATRDVRLRTARATASAHDLSSCLWLALEQSLGAAAALPFMRALVDSLEAHELPRVEAVPDALPPLAEALHERGLAVKVAIEEAPDEVLVVRIAQEGECYAPVPLWVGVWTVYALTVLLGRPLGLEHHVHDGSALVLRARPRRDARADRRRALIHELDQSTRRR